jgi:DNA-binding CsgD family transcriptional regulator
MAAKPPRKPKTRKPTRPSNIVDAQRTKRALELRLEGKTYARIGEEIGIDESNAWRHVAKAMAKMAAQRAKDAETLLEAELARFDRLQSAAWDKALGGDLDAIRTCLSVITARAKLLGLEPATRIQVSAEDVQAMARQMAETATTKLLETLPPELAEDAVKVLGDAWAALRF